jgi:hypothetical protein
VDARHEVLRAAEARGRALAEADADRLRRLLHDRFRWTSHTGETFTREEYVHRNTSGPVRWRSQELTGVEVTVVGDTAVLWAEVTDVVEGDDHPETYRMPMTQVWVHEAGTWHCLAGHAGPRRP